MSGNFLRWLTLGVVLLLMASGSRVASAEPVSNTAVSPDAVSSVPDAGNQDASSNGR